jgi:hypothetical protein
MAFLVLGGLTFAAIALFLTVALVGTIIHLAVRLILLPLLLLKWIIAGIVMLVVGPIVLVVGIVGFVVAAIALALPLLPLLLVAGIIWMIVRANRPAAVA